MTEEQKDILIARMLEHPWTLSDAEIELILGDEELRDIYSLSADVKRAYQQPANVDAKKEWLALKPRLAHKRTWSTWRIAAVAAAVVGIVIGAGIIAGVLKNETRPQPELILAQTIAEENEVVDVTAIDNSPRQPIAESQAPKSVAIAKATASAEKQPIIPEAEVEEYLRTVEARIDNEFAMLNADEIMTQVHYMTQGRNVEATPVATYLQSVDNTAEANGFMYVIMQ